MGAKSEITHTRNLTSDAEKGLAMTAQGQKTGWTRNEQGYYIYEFPKQSPPDLGDLTRSWRGFFDFDSGKKALADINTILDRVKGGKEIVTKWRKGEIVRFIQRGLNAWAETTDKSTGIKVDGDFRTDIESVLRRFQESNGLNATGTFDKSTVIKFEELELVKAGLKPLTDRAVELDNLAKSLKRITDAILQHDVKPGEMDVNKPPIEEYPSSRREPGLGLNYFPIPERLEKHLK